MNWASYNAAQDDGSSPPTPSDSGNGPTSDDQGPQTTVEPAAPAAAAPYSGEQHTQDIAAQHGISTDHLYTDNTNRD